MLEISELKAMSLADLKQLAKALAIPKHTALNKVDLIYKIMEFKAQAEEQVNRRKRSYKRSQLKMELKAKKGLQKKHKITFFPKFLLNPMLLKSIESEERTYGKYG
jgi:hypothetical protein